MMNLLNKNRMINNTKTYIRNAEARIADGKKMLSEYHRNKGMMSDDDYEWINAAIRDNISSDKRFLKVLREQLSDDLLGIGDSNFKMTGKIDT